MCSRPLTKKLPQQLRIGGDTVGYEFRQPFSKLVSSPLNSVVQYREVNIIPASILNFGMQNGDIGMISMYQVNAVSGISLTLHLGRQELQLQFPLKVGEGEHTFVFKLPISQLSHICKHHSGTTSSAFVIPYDRPPQAFIQDTTTIDRDRSEQVWNIWSSMFRETDIVDKAAMRQTLSLPLLDHKASAIIDIGKARSPCTVMKLTTTGRWTSYHLTFSDETASSPQFNELCRALSDFGVPVRNSEPFTIITEQPTSLSAKLEDEFTGLVSHQQSVQKVSTTVSVLASDRVHLQFSVRYQLEACLSNGFIKESNVTLEFLERLSSMTPHEAVYILEKVADLQHVYYDPMEVFTIRCKNTKRRSIPKYCVMQRSVNITPTMMYVASPVMEISNRIIRQNLTDSDRFIRVKFSDEKGDGPLRNMQGGRAEALFDRVAHAMRNGIVVAGRYYEFLAFGNSQLREHGAYFYAPTSTKSADDIRMNLGHFDHIKTVAKYGARMGQAFSTTRAMRYSVVTMKTPDIESNGCNFTDGVGRLSPFLAKMIAQELGLPNAFNDPPTLYQFRLGGCKGVLALDPTITKNEVHIRPSQMKFNATHTGLEIIRCSNLATPFLNRQIITLLSDLGVKDHVFIRKQQEMVASYELAMTDKDEALRWLLKHIDVNQTTLMMASMVLDGFFESQEPLMMSLLHLWRACTMKELKKRARVAIDEGAFVLGCVDETGTLQGHRNEPQSRVDATREEKMNTLPEIFIQIDDVSKKGHYKVIEGVCVLARNPSLHPGDIRVVRAVDAPVLRHHKNVVVLPQTGDRDLASMCSGGDLDGDDYMVLWDSDLIPDIVNVPPMDFTPEKLVERTGPISASDVSDFFVTYMKNDSLGQIAHAHLAQADQQPSGTFSDVCKDLAKKHSQAVDYPKSGNPAIMDISSRPLKWPHFMEKKHLAPSKIYHSANVQGLMYDKLKPVEFDPTKPRSCTFDQRVLGSFGSDDPLLKKAAQIKADYDDELRRLMAKHGVRTEFEAFSAFVLSHNNETTDYKFAESFGQTVGALKAQYREVCLIASGANNVMDWDRLGPFVAAMYTVTAEEVTSVSEQEADMTMPFLSFPWLFHKEVGKLATGGISKPGIEHLRPSRLQKHRTDNNQEFGDLGTVGAAESLTHFDGLLGLTFEDDWAVTGHSEE